MNTSSFHPLFDTRTQRPRTVSVVLLSLLPLLAIAVVTFAVWWLLQYEVDRLTTSTGTSAVPVLRRADIEFYAKRFSDVPPAPPPVPSSVARPAPTPSPVAVP